MQKTTTNLLLLLFSVVLFSQEQNTSNSFLKNLNGSLESNIQWYNNDTKLGSFEEEHHLRANSYLKLDYSFLKNLTIGIQAESYEPTHLLNYYSGYKKTNIATYYAQYKTKKLDLTAGYFYEQFGSGLLLRAFEERQLGLNNALRGGRIKYSPTNYLNFTALYGKNRIAFNVAKSSIYGFDTNFNLTEAFNLESVTNLSFGASYVGKKEDYTPENSNFNTSNFPKTIHSFTARVDADLGNFYTNIEYSFKGKDVSFTPISRGLQEIIEGKYYDGNAILFTTGYTKKGIGLTGTFRRLENMSFYAERNFGRTSQNQFNMLSINYIPALTKQQDYSLANIYIYQAQPNLVIDGVMGQAGEIGGQLDFFYNFKRGSNLGGKYGTKLTANFAYWSLLNTKFNTQNYTYKTIFFKFGKRVNRDFSIELRKKWSKNWNSIFTYLNQTVDKGVSLGGPLGIQGEIKSQVGIAETTIKLPKRKSIRLEAQHLWTKNDQKNWVGGTIEFNLSRHFSIYGTDIYNYENTIKKNRVHYYNIGGSFTKKATRIALNYGRQRGGLICVGGVCRYVSPNTGLTVNINTSF